jgi:hypothetical protein
MTAGLSTFSDWTLALLPRLFIYPGGLWMLVALVGLRFVAGGRACARPGTFLDDLSRGRLLPLATAWGGFALLPLPGAQPMPFPVDGFSLCALLALSLVFSQALEQRVDWREGIIGVAITLALLVPAIGERALLAAGSDGGLPTWLSMLAVGVGLAVLVPSATRDLAAGVRWLGWLGLLISDFGFRISDFAWLWASLAYALGIGILAWTGKSLAARVGDDVGVAITWGLVGLSLLVALLA